jgi:hypothetical protein
MAGNQTQYALIFVTVDGPLLVQQTEMSVKRETKSTAVATVAGGYMGESPGAAMCTVSVSNAIPLPKLEFNAGPNMAALKPNQVYFAYATGAIQLKTTVQIIEDTLTHGVDKAGSYSFQARGAFADWS